MENSDSDSAVGSDGMESIIDDDDEEMDSEDEEEESPRPSQVFMPGKSSAASDGEDQELECDESVYILYHRIQTGAPCLSFDIIPDKLGDSREDSYPMTSYVIGGTQSERTHVNNLVVMKLSNMRKNKYGPGTKEDSDSELSEEEDDEDKPELETALIPHRGCVNRVKVKSVSGKILAASWSELKCVQIWDLSHPLEAVDDPKILGPYVRNSEAPKASFTFKGHQAEGFSIDWSPVKEGVLATGDCKKNIHLWTPMEGGTWHVDQKPYNSHTDSVEDLQWSPNEANVLASCSVDRSIRIWDMRAAPHKACMLTNPDAHERDVNVISWNRIDPFLLSGGDDGCLKVWDIRQFKINKPLCVFKHHFGPISSVEWHPTDSTVFAASGEDDQVTLWDLAVEKDPEAEKVMENESSNAPKDESNLSNLPPQLLFIHQGQKHIKEIHWHRQMPGVLLTTAQTGFNVFRTISI